MPALVTSLLLGLRQLADRTVLRILLKSLVVSLLAFLGVAVGAYLVLDAALAWAGLEDTLFGGAGALRSAASLVLAVLGLGLTWRIVAMAVIQFYADEVVLAVERRHYPEAAAQSREVPLARQARNAAAAAARALIANLLAAPIALALLFTGIGPAIVFWAVNALLLGRELRDMVWLRHHQTTAGPAPIGGAQRFALGGAIAALLAVPFANFLAPVIGAASATHLVHRQSSNRRDDSRPD